MGLLGSIFNAVFSGGDSEVADCDWYCDQCNAWLNMQSGFTTATGEWTCTECGFENDVTSANILSDSMGYSDIHSGDNENECFSDGDICTHCGGSLSGALHFAPWEDDDNEDEFYVCPHCGCKNYLSDD